MVEKRIQGGQMRLKHTIAAILEENQDELFCPFCTKPKGDEIDCCDQNISLSGRMASSTPRSPAARFCAWHPTEAPRKPLLAPAAACWALTLMPNSVLPNKFLTHRKVYPLKRLTDWKSEFVYTNSMNTDISKTFQKFKQE